METATVVVAPAPVAITQTPQHKLMELKSSFAAVAKPSTPRKVKPAKKKLAGGCGGYVLEDVPHLTDYLPELKVSPKLIHLIIFLEKREKRLL
jgi:6-phosphofructokinase 1